MEGKGSIVNSAHTLLRIYPSRKFTAFLNTLPGEEGIPENILKVIGINTKGKNNNNKIDAKPNIGKTDIEIRHMKKINKVLKVNTRYSDDSANKYWYYGDSLAVGDDGTLEKQDYNKKYKSIEKTFSNGDECIKRADKVFSDKKIDDCKEGKVQIDSKPFLTTLDIDWVYSFLQAKKSKGVDVPFLHVLMEGANIRMPENKSMKRNPELESRCRKLEIQQEGQEYTTASLKITVDDLSVKMKHFEAISYQRRKLRTPFTFANWNKYIHKRNKVEKKEKEHQD